MVYNLNLTAKIDNIRLTNLDTNMNYGMNDMQMRSDGKNDRRSKSRPRGEDDDEPINVNDVEFEHQVDYDDDDGEMHDPYQGAN